MLVGTKAQPGDWGDWRPVGIGCFVDHLNVETNSISRSQRGGGASNACGGSFRIDKELLLKYIRRHQNNEGKGPFEYVCRARNWRASQSNKCVEDEDGRMPQHSADGKTPSSPKNWVWYFSWEQPEVGYRGLLFLLVGTEGAMESGWMYAAR
jgi:hypothetical protein